LHETNKCCIFDENIVSHLKQHVMVKFNFKLNGKTFSSNEGTISGGQILEIAGLLPQEDFNLFMKITHKDFEPVEMYDQIDLTEPGVEQFKAKPKKELHFEVDDEKYSTTELELTPVQILTIAGLKSEEYYLKQIVDHQEITFKDKENELISMFHNPRFISCKKGPATVSYSKKL
jgi:hypothetical protein